MDDEEFSQRAKEVIEYILEYKRTIQNRRVTPDVKPGFLQNLLPLEAPKDPESFDSVMKDVDEKIMIGITHWEHPQFHAYFPHGASYPSFLANMISDMFSVVGFSWASSPALTELEYIMLNWFGQMIGLPEQFLYKDGSEGGGSIQVGASESIFNCLFAARHKKIASVREISKNLSDTDILSKLVAYCSKESHSCVEKAAYLGFVKLAIVDPDEHNSMRGKALQEAIDEDIENGLIPFFAVATIGTTSSCAFDNIEEIGPICDEHGIWLHIDGAYGGNAMICEEFRYLMKGIEYVTSVNVNPHKWMLVHSECSCMWVKNRFDLTNAFTVDPLYLQHSHSSKILDLRHWGVPLTRTFRALKMWFTFRIYGVSALKQYIRRHCQLAKYFADLVLQDERFEICNDVVMGLVCFRLRADDEVNKTLLTELNNSGNIHMVPAQVQGRFVLRFTICYEHQTEDDLDDAWQIITDTASDVLHCYNALEKELEDESTCEYTPNKKYLVGEESVVCAGSELTQETREDDDKAVTMEGSSERYSEVQPEQYEATPAEEAITVESSEKLYSSSEVEKSSFSSSSEQVKEKSSIASRSEEVVEKSSDASKSEFPLEPSSSHTEQAQEKSTFSSISSSDEGSQEEIEKSSFAGTSEQLIEKSSSSASRSELPVDQEEFEENEEVSVGSSSQSEESIEKSSYVSESAPLEEEPIEKSSSVSESTPAEEEPIEKSSSVSESAPAEEEPIEKSYDEDVEKSFEEDGEKSYEEDVDKSYDENIEKSYDEDVEESKRSSRLEGVTERTSSAGRSEPEIEKSSYVCRSEKETERLSYASRSERGTKSPDEGIGKSSTASRSEQSFGGTYASHEGTEKSKSTYARRSDKETEPPYSRTKSKKSYAEQPYVLSEFKKSYSDQQFEHSSEAEPYGLSDKGSYADPKSGIEQPYGLASESSKKSDRTFGQGSSTYVGRSDKPYDLPSESTKKSYASRSEQPYGLVSEYEKKSHSTRPQPSGLASDSGKKSHASRLESERKKPKSLPKKPHKKRPAIYQMKVKETRSIFVRMVSDLKHYHPQVMDSDDSEGSKSRRSFSSWMKKSSPSDSDGDSDPSAFSDEFAPQDNEKNSTVINESSESSNEELSDDANSDDSEESEKSTGNSDSKSPNQK